MLPAYAKAHGIEYSVREGWLTGCLDRLQKEKNTAAEKKITLAIAFPSEESVSEGKEVVDGITYYGFKEDLGHPEIYDESLESKFKQIIEDFKPDMMHVFGTEFPHALAALRAFGRPERSLVGIQGVCTEIAKAYMAGLPKKVQESTTFRDRLKEDSLIQQQEKFRLRAENEKKVLLLTGNVTGRTTFDKEKAFSRGEGSVCRRGVAQHQSACRVFCHERDHETLLLFGKMGREESYSSQHFSFSGRLSA